MFNVHRVLPIFYESKINGQRYKDEILGQHLRLSEVQWVHTLCLRTIIQIPMENFFEEEDIRHMQWPACSPDMNPIGDAFALVRRILQPVNLL